MCTVTCSSSLPRPDCHKTQPWSENGWGPSRYGDALRNGCKNPSEKQPFVMETTKRDPLGGQKKISRDPEPCSSLEFASRSAGKGTITSAFGHVPAANRSAQVCRWSEYCRRANRSAEEKLAVHLRDKRHRASMHGATGIYDCNFYFTSSALSVALLAYPVALRPCLD